MEHAVNKLYNNNNNNTYIHTYIQYLYAQYHQIWKCYSLPIRQKFIPANTTETIKFSVIT